MLVQNLTLDMGCIALHSMEDFVENNDKGTDFEKKEFLDCLPDRLAESIMNSCYAWDIQSNNIHRIDRIDLVDMEIEFSEEKSPFGTFMGTQMGILSNMINPQLLGDLINMLNPMLLPIDNSIRTSAEEILYKCLYGIQLISILCLLRDGESWLSNESLSGANLISDALIYNKWWNNIVNGVSPIIFNMRNMQTSKIEPLYLVLEPKLVVYPDHERILSVTDINLVEVKPDSE